MFSHSPIRKVLRSTLVPGAAPTNNICGVNLSVVSCVLNDPTDILTPQDCVDIQYPILQCSANITLTYIIENNGTVPISILHVQGVNEITDSVAKDDRNLDANDSVTYTEELLDFNICNDNNTIIDVTPYVIANVPGTVTGCEDRISYVLHAQETYSPSSPSCEPTMSPSPVAGSSSPSKNGKGNSLKGKGKTKKSSRCDNSKGRNGSSSTKKGKTSNKSKVAATYSPSLNSWFPSSNFSGKKKVKNTDAPTFEARSDIETPVPTVFNYGNDTHISKGLATHPPTSYSTTISSDKFNTNVEEGEWIGSASTEEPTFAIRPDVETLVPTPISNRTPSPAIVMTKSPSTNIIPVRTQNHILCSNHATLTNELPHNIHNSTVFYRAEVFIKPGVSWGSISQELSRAIQSQASLKLIGCSEKNKRSLKSVDIDILWVNFTALGDQPNTEPRSE